MVISEGIIASSAHKLRGMSTRNGININFYDTPRPNVPKTTKTRDAIRSGENVEVETAFIRIRGA